MNENSDQIVFREGYATAMPPRRTRLDEILDKYQRPSPAAGFKAMMVLAIARGWAKYPAPNPRARGRRCKIPVKFL